MELNYIQIVMVIVFAGIAWWANNALNKVPVLVTVVNVVIVLIAVVLLFQSFGWMGSMPTHSRI